MQSTNDYVPPPAAIISLNHWVSQVGVTPVTAWRWRKRGWLQTINIAGRQYLTRESLETFQRRAEAGEFAKEYTVPKQRLNAAD